MAKSRKVAARVSIQKAVCEVYSTGWIECPLCHTQVPPNVRHDCEVDGGIKTVRNRPVKDLSELADEL